MRLATRFWAAQETPAMTKHPVRLCRCLITVAVMVASLACRQPASLAPRVTRNGLAALRVGMSPSDVRAHLGAPLSDMVGPEPNERLQFYGRASEFVVGGTRIMSMARGVDCLLMFRDDKLRRVHVNDMDAKAICVCVEGHCGTDWVDECTSLAP